MNRRDFFKTIGLGAEPHYEKANVGCDESHLLWKPKVCARIDMVSGEIWA